VTLVTQIGYVRQKETEKVFHCHFRLTMLLSEWMDSGSEFQARDPVSEKARLPSLILTHDFGAI